MKSIDPVYKKFVGSVARTLSNTEFYTYFKDVLSAGDTTYQFSNRRLEKQVDEVWVRELEMVVKPMQEIINNPRNFIKTEEVIVNVALAKKTTPETVRHLSQHGDMIDSVSQDSVRPNRLMEKYKEDTWNTYENKFVYTLLEMAWEFVDRRYETIFASLDEQLGAFMKMSTSCFSYQEKIDVNMDIRIQQDEDLLSADNNNETILSRIARLHRIFGNFRNTNFAKVMSKFGKIRQPLVRTNAIAKNPNFKACHRLWNFIINYHDVGYKINVYEQSSEIPDEFVQDLYSSIIINYIILKNRLERQEDRAVDVSKPFKKRAVAPKFNRRIVEEFTDNYDEPYDEVRKVLVEEITMDRLMKEEESVRRQLVQAQENERAERARAERIETQRREKEEERQRLKDEKERRREEERKEKERLAELARQEKEKERRELEEKKLAENVRAMLDEILGNRSSVAAAIEAEYVAAEKAATEKAEAERLAAEQAAAEKAEAERIASEMAATATASAQALEAIAAGISDSEEEVYATELVAGAEPEYYVTVDENSETYQEILRKEKAGEVKLVYRYRKSFIANLVLSSENVQNYYSQLKNYIFSYEGTDSKIRWKNELFKNGKNQIAKIVAKPTSLYVYFAIDPKELDADRYTVEDASGTKKFAEVPTLMKIKGERRLKRAFEIVDMICGGKLGLEQGVVKTVDYRMDPLSIEELVEQGYILYEAGVIPIHKILVAADTSAQPVAEDVAQTKNDVPAESAEPAEATVTEADLYGEEFEDGVHPDYCVKADENSEEYRQLLQREQAGEVKLVYRDKRTLASDLMFSAENVQNFYSLLKNYILSYNKATAKVAGRNELFKNGKNKIAKVLIQQATLYVYLAIAPNELDQSRYGFEDVSSSKKNADTPTLIKIKSERKLKRTCEIVDKICGEKLGLQKGTAEAVDYRVNPMPVEELVAQGFVLREAGVISLVPAQEENYPTETATDEIAATEYAEPAEESAVTAEYPVEEQAFEAETEAADVAEEVSEAELAAVEAESEAMIAKENSDVVESVSADETAEEIEEPKADEAADNAEVSEPVQEAEPVAVENTASDEDAEDEEFMDGARPDYYINAEDSSEKYQELLRQEKAGEVKLVYRYKRSFTANLILSTDTIQDYYSQLKNYILSYSGATSKISWKNETFKKTKNKIAKILAKQATLYVYLAVDPKELDGSRFAIEDVSSMKRFSETPTLIRIKGERKFKHACEIIDIICGEKLGLKQGDIPTVDYRMAPMSTDELIAQGFILRQAGVIPVSQLFEKGKKPFQTASEKQAKSGNAELSEAPVAQTAEEPAAIDVKELHANLDRDEMKIVKALATDGNSKSIEEIAREINPEKELSKKDKKLLQNLAKKYAKEVQKQKRFEEKKEKKTRKS